MRLAPMKAIQQLQLEVLNRFGTTPLQPSDCKDLSTLIRDHTGKIVSETTIKRFYGFAAQTFNFSVYTLNALSEYSGCHNWEFFLEHYRQQLTPQIEFHPKWQEIKSKTGKITFYTTEAIKNNCRIDFAKTAPRVDACPLHHFLNSDSTTSVMLAPASCGKSIALAQMVEAFWLQESCLYPNDVCLFINIHHLNTLINRGFSMEDWLDNQLNFGDGENIIEYFEQHTTEKNGKFILIVDGFDDKVLGNDKLRVIYSKLMDLVFSRTHTKWLKVIIAARPDVWSILFNPLHSAIRPHWQGGLSVEAEQEPGVIFNLPLLSASEIKTVLCNHSVPEGALHGLGDSFIQLLEFPPFLQMACQIIDTQSATPIHEDYLTYNIIGQYARCRVMTSADYGIKTAILRKVLEETYGQTVPALSGQVKLFSGDIRVQEVYRKLLADNILIEESQEGIRSLPIKRVRFINAPMAEFFMATFCVFTHNGQITDALITECIAQYDSGRSHLSFLRWILLYAIDQQDYQGVMTLFNRVSSLKDKALLFEFLLIQQSAPDSLSQMMRDILRQDLPFKQYFLRSFLLYDAQGYRQNYFRENLQALLETEDDQVNVASIYFLAGIYQLDGRIMSSQIPLLNKSVMKLNRMGSTLHPGELALFIYNSLNERKTDDITRDKILQFEDYLLLSDHTILSLKDEMTVYLLMYCAQVLKEYKLLDRITDYVFNEIPSLKMRSHDPFRIVSLLIKSRYYLYEHDHAHYNKCLKHVDNVLATGSSITGLPLIIVYQEQVKAIRQYIDGEYDKVLDSVQRALVIAKSIRFVLFEHWCYQMQASAFHALRKQKLAMLAEQEADRIRERSLLSILIPFDFNGFVSEFTCKQAINH